MWHKEITLIAEKKPVGYLLTSILEGTKKDLVYFTNEAALADLKRGKIPPYTTVNTDGFIMPTVKSSARNLLKSFVGNSVKSSLSVVETAAPKIKQSLLNTGLPCLAGICLQNIQGKNYVWCKLICKNSPKADILIQNLLAVLVMGMDEVLGYKAVRYCKDIMTDTTGTLKYCEGLIVAVDALKQLSSPVFLKQLKDRNVAIPYFLCSTLGIEDFNYKQMNMADNVVPKITITNFCNFANEYNNTIISKLRTVQQKSVVTR